MATVSTAWCAVAATGPAAILTQPQSQTVFYGEPATFTVVADGTPPVDFQWFRNGVPLAGATASAYTIPAVGTNDHGAFFTVQAENDEGRAVSALALLTVDFGTPGPLQTNALVPLTTWWRQDTGGTLPPGWEQPGFDDDAWALGRALFGTEGTALPGPTNALLPSPPPVTTLFRTRFGYTPGSDLPVTLLATLLADDGAVVYLNGAEAWRTGMPAGTTAAGTLANRLVAQPAFDAPVEIPLGRLVPGDNDLAIELHQAATNDLDAAFGLCLGLVSRPRLRDTNAPALAGTLPAAGSTVGALTQIEVHFTEGVQGVDAADLLVNGTPAGTMTAYAADVYSFQFPPQPAGPVLVTWAAGHGITDLSANSNAFGGAGFSLAVSDTPAPADVRINEFLAANQGGLRDEDGAHSDWIELFNAGAAGVNLAGWHLTDDSGRLTKWRFPTVTIPASGYLLVWASEKNRTNPAAPLHTNFKLDKSGEFLGLVRSDGVTIASAFAPTYPAQSDDVSYGRDPADPALMGYFSTPTPRAANSSAGAGYGPDVQFSVTSGTFQSAFNLELSVPDTNWVIRYFAVSNAAFAAVQNVPNASSPIYSNPLPISVTTQIRARAYPRQGTALPGPGRSETFVQITAAAATFTSDLPLILLHNFGGGTVPATTDQASVMLVFEPLGGRSSLTNPPTVASRIGLNIRGSSTQGLPKSSYAVETWNEFNADSNLSLLGMPEESDWVLFAPNSYDRLGLHNPLAHQLSRDIGRYSPRTRFAEVFLQTASGALNFVAPAGGQYYGLYVIEEKIKRNAERVDITKLEPENNTVPSVTGGYLLKIDRADADERVFSTSYGQSIVYQDPDGVDIQLAERDAQEQYIIGYFSAFENVLYGVNYTNPVTGYAAWMDADSWVDHHILNLMPFNVDALRLSGYFFKERSRRIEMGPLWDFDRALGSSDGRPFNPRLWRVQASGDQGTDFFGNPSLLGVQWWSRLFRDPDFWQRWIDRWQALRRDAFSTNHLSAVLDGLAAQIREAEVRDVARWGGNGGSDPRPRSGTVTMNGYTHSFPGTFQGEVDFLKGWLADRVDFLDTNFLSAPVFSSTGGTITGSFMLTITAPTRVPNSTIYFTLDGSDPRLPGGALSPKALSNLNTATVTLTTNARVVARNFNLLHANVTNYPGAVGGNPPISSSWSGPAAATFYATTPPLRITEIMYHPAAPPAGNTNDADNFEYLEFRNLSASPLQLAGFRLSGGVEFTFPSLLLAAGARVTVVKDLVAFRSRYGSGPLVAGFLTNNLGNGGDHLVLEGPLKEPILDFRYSDAWYPTTDGLGFSLVIVDDSAPADSWGLAESWQASGAVGGSPAAAEPATPDIPPVLVNEALTHTDPPDVDAIELFNPNDAAVNLAGWFLTDDFRTPRKYRIPAGVSIPARGFVVFTEAQFNQGTSAFGLSATGEEAYLFSGDATTNLTGYYHGFSFGAAANGVSFGRHVTSTGAEHFVAQQYHTLGASNGPPRVGPVVVSEIMFAPLAGGGLDVTNSEFVELANLAATNAPLFDPAFPTNVWRLRGGVDFDFPPGTSLPPAGRLLVTSFNPADAATLAAFRSRYGVPAGVPVLGPWSGRLDNAGEALELQRPDAPNLLPTGVEVPRILVERIEYSPLAPWPTGADSTGNSLQRLTLSSYSDEPTNWFAAGITAGRANTFTRAPSVSLLSPTNGAALFRSPFLLLAANPADPDGTVAGVEFYDDATLLGGVTNAPWQFAWSNAPFGSHTLSARAVDNLGAGAWSTPVSITVISEPPYVTLALPTNAAILRLGQAATLQANATDNDGTVARVDFFANGQFVASDATSPFTASWTPAAAGDATLLAVATDDSSLVRTSAVVSVFVQNVLGDFQPVSTGSVWNYLDDGSDQGTGWRGTNFSDATWASGPAQLGFGDGDEATVINGGPAANRTVTLYLRKSFFLPSPGGITNAGLRVLRDDGVVAYLNGVEIFRNNMPATAIGYRTYASSAVTGTGESTFYSTNVPVALLVAGTNVLAAEVHQANATSGDSSFDAELTLQRYLLGPAITAQPQNRTAPTGSNVVLTTAASGTAPLAWQWLFNGAPLAGRTTSALALAAVQFTNAGGYSAVVTNVGGAVTSAVATLTVVWPDTDGDGLPDWWEAANGTNPLVPDATADPDHDGLTNGQEYLAGTQPTNAASVLRLQADPPPTAGALVLSFDAVSNRAYAFETRPGTGVVWTNWVTLPPASTNRVLRLTNNLTSETTRYFRLLTTGP